MSLMSEQVQSLNQIVAIISQKSDTYRNERMRMHSARSSAEKKLILDLIADAELLANEIKPTPLDLLQDLLALRKRL